MTREKIINHILASIKEPSGAATVSRIALDTMQPPVIDRIEFLCVLAYEIGCLVEEHEDGGYRFYPDYYFPEGWRRFCGARETRIPGVD